MFQGRPFREGIRENSALWWGLVGASAVAFSGATDFMPELNRWLQIVEMEGSVSVLSSYVDIGLTSCQVQNTFNGYNDYRFRWVLDT
jgi:cation-transporting ATPase 13A1